MEVEGMINQTSVTILIDPGASLSYIAPQIVEKCKLSVEKFWEFMVSSVSHWC